MIEIGIVGCGRIMAAHLRGYRLLREAGVDDFRITALCSLTEDEARMYVRRGQGPPQRPAVSHFAGDPLAAADEYVSDFQDDVRSPNLHRLSTYDGRGSDYRRQRLHQPRPASRRSPKPPCRLGQRPVDRKADGRLRIEPPAKCVNSPRHGNRVLGVFQSGRYHDHARDICRWLFDSGRIGRTADDA